VRQDAAVLQVVLAQPWVDILAYGGRGGRCVGVMLEVSAPPLRDG